MDQKLVSGALLCFILLGFLSGVTPEPVQCIKWRQVYPNCPCISAFDDNGNELPAVAVVDCSNKGLVAIPQAQDTYDATLHEFRLTGNQITTLPDDAFSGIKIQTVNLLGNKITNMSENAFRGTANEVLHLFIEGDDKSAPPRSAMMKLINLRSITIKGFSIPHLSEDSGEMLFLNFPFLSVITLESNGIQSIDPHAFLAADNRYSLRRLTILNQQLFSIPPDVFFEPELKNLEHLQISYCQFTSVFQNIFSRLNFIKEIILSNNKISVIEEDSFISVGDSLEKIDLSNNNLGENGADNLIHMKDLSNLKELVLHHNLLTTVPTMEQIGAGQGFKLDLSFNKIDTFSANALASYGERLIGLDLSSNKIAQINDQVFSKAMVLQSFDVKNQGGNFVSLRVPTSLTQAANSLTYLDYSGQPVDKVSLWRVLESLNQLQVINLHSIDLTNIPDFAFEKQTKLTRLDLSFNSINQITDKTFVGPRQLEHLLLRSTSIQNLPACLFYKQEASLNLDFGGLLITCDCSVKTLVDDFKRGFISFPDASAIPTCSGGLGKRLTEFDPSALTCEPRQCEDYYTTQSPQITTTDNKTPQEMAIQIALKETTMSSISIEWRTTGNSTGISTFKVIASNSDGNDKFDKTFQPNVRTADVTPLSANTHYNVCVYANFVQRKPVSHCVFFRTDSAPTTSPTNDDDSDSANTGIIIGCVVGGLAFLAIVVAIIYLMFIRRRPKKLPSAPVGMAGPVQPRAFAKSELPSMNGDSKTFVKAKKNGSGKSKAPVGGGMQVVAISDGQTGRPSSSGRVGRAAQLAPDGTYKPMDKKSRPVSKDDTDYEPMKKPYGQEYDGMKGAVNSAYENDHGSLPPTPTSPRNSTFDSSSRPPSYHAYYNEAFNNDKYEEVML